MTPLLPGEPHEPLARAMHQLGVGRKGDRLLLHGRVDDDLLEKSDGFAAPVLVATERLSCTSAASFSSPMR
jgi:hypothetical protein